MGEAGRPRVGEAVAGQQVVVVGAGQELVVDLGLEVAALVHGDVVDDQGRRLVHPELLQGAASKLDRIGRIDDQAAALRDSAGTGTVAGNLTDALLALFGSAAVAIVGLITFRDDLRARLRQARPAGGVPVLTEATAMIAAYLTAERDLGRIAADADVGTLAPTLIGAGHLLFADRAATPPEPAAVHKVVTTVIAGVLSPSSAGRG
jgi:hypothetical protein